MPFYNALKNEDICNGESGNMVYLDVFWFGPMHKYNSVLVGPFGNGPHHQQQIITVKNMMEHVQVLHEWMQVVLFGGD